jgi:hypothetical protein
MQVKVTEIQRSHHCQEEEEQSNYPEFGTQATAKIGIPPKRGQTPGIDHVQFHCERFECLRFEQEFHSA